MIPKETLPPNKGIFEELGKRSWRVFSKNVLRRESLSSQQRLEKEAENLIDLALFGAETFSERFNIQDRWGIYPYQLEIFNYWFAYYILKKSDYELKKLSDSEIFVTDQFKPILVTANKKDQHNHKVHMLAAEHMRGGARDASDRFSEFVNTISTIIIQREKLDNQQSSKGASDALEIVGSPSALRNAANILSIFYIQWKEGRLNDDEFGKKIESFISNTQIISY